MEHIKRDSKSTMFDVFSTFSLFLYTKLVIISAEVIEPEFIPIEHEQPPNTQGFEYRSKH